jgi:hypothetical protein
MAVVGRKPPFIIEVGGRFYEVQHVKEARVSHVSRREGRLTWSGDGFGCKVTCQPTCSVLRAQRPESGSMCPDRPFAIAEEGALTV